MSDTFVPRTERQRWQDIADALNAAHAAGMPVGVDLDGTLTDHTAWSVVWDRSAGRWAVAGYDDESMVPGEKCIPAGEQPVEDGATHRHPRPCEFPEVLPCRCVRPGRLPDSAFVTARARARIAGFFRCAAAGRADAAELQGWQP